MKEIIIIADNRFPVTYAATTRIYMLCRLFAALGYQTTVFIINVNEKRRFQFEEDYIKCRWFSWEETSAFRFFKENKSVVEAVKGRKNLKYVILYQEILAQTLSVQKMAASCGFEVIAYFDEWYEWGKTGNDTFMERMIRSASIRISEYWIAPRIKKKIVISRGLKRFFRKKNCLLLPTLIDIEDSIWEREESGSKEKIVILYAGWPGNRDDLRYLAEVVDELPAEEKARLMLKIYTYATSEEELKAHIPDLERIKRENAACIAFLGEVKREKVIEELKEADFSYLLREDKWSNNAGFSTKIGESLAAGAPMFANCTSDIGYYIKDGFNGILIENMSKEAVRRGLIKILGLSTEKRERMKRNACKTAARFFDYQQYLEKMEKFLEK